MENVTLDNQICSHQSCLESFAMKFTDNTEDANDLVQDTIIKAMHYRNLYQPGTNLRGWLYTIMKNTFINQYRRSVKRSAIIDTNEELNSAQLHTSADRNLGESKFIEEDISRALNKLPKAYSVPFLRYFEGYRYHEIAEELNIPIGTIKTRIHMARRLLKSELRMYREHFKSGLKSA